MGTPRSLLDFVRVPKPVYGPPSPNAPPGSDLPVSLTALIDLVRGATVGAGDDPNRWLRAGELAAAVPFGSLRSLTGLVKGATRGGFFSRVDDAVAMLLPAKGAHPNKVASILKSNASAEELAYRNVPQFLAGKGNAIVTPGELQAHLAKHPAPVPTVVKLGEHHNLYDEYVSQLEAKYGEGFEKTSLSPVERTELDRRWASANQRGGMTAREAKYAQYQLPGGEQYRETLLTLPEQPVTDLLQREAALQAELTALQPELSAAHRADSPAYDALSARRDALTRELAEVKSTRRTTQESSFRSGHFDEPNILVHTRANERTLPTGERGRFVEEVQSDWHQKGKKEGYQADLPDLPPLVAHGDVTIARGDSQWIATTPDGRRVAIGMGTVDGETEARSYAKSYFNNRREELAQMRREDAREMVPDAPFKETWPDLGLKQQLLETAADPQASWLGFTSGQTQAARYDLSKRFSEVHYSGSNLKAYDLNGNEVISQTGVRAADLPDYLGDEGAARLLAQPKQGTLQSLTGVDLQVGGEGMEHFYDRLLPKRLEKVLKPFGGTVERGAIPRPIGTVDALQHGQIEPSPQLGEAFFDVLAQTGTIQGKVPVGRNATLMSREELAQAFASQALTPSHFSPAIQKRVSAAGMQEPAWIARLTPEMKARILKEGLPLLTLPLAAWVASQEQPPSDAELFSLSRFARRPQQARRPQ